MGIRDIEKEFGFEFPLPHRADLLDVSSPIHDACDFLIPGGPGLLVFLRVNRSLRRESWQGWAGPYVAFASYGCGDYFAYNTSTRPYTIVYVDPLEPVAKSSGAGKHYAEWREMVLKQAAEVDEDFV